MSERPADRSSWTRPSMAPVKAGRRALEEADRSTRRQRQGNAKLTFRRCRLYCLEVVYGKITVSMRSYAVTHALAVRNGFLNLKVQRCTRPQETPKSIVLGRLWCKGPLKLREVLVLNRVVVQHARAFFPCALCTSEDPYARFKAAMSQSTKRPSSRRFHG